MKEDILEALECLKTFDDTFETILGLNEKESYEIAELYGKSKEDFLLFWRKRELKETENEENNS